MRAFLFVVGVLALLPVHSSAQVSDDSPTRAPITSSVRSLHGMTQVGTLGSMPTNPRVHCCNRKGALIGAAIGVALGAALATLCDAGDCTSAYLGSMAILGGIGAGLGALVHPSSVTPGAGPNHSAAGVAPGLRPGFVPLRF